MKRLNGKTAVITGAGGGIGTATALRFASEGANIICQDLDGEAAKRTQKAVEEAGAKAMAWECDVADSSAIDKMFEAASSELGTINVLVNNAGVDRIKGDGLEKIQSSLEQLAMMPDSSWQKMLDIHLNGAFYCTRAMSRHLIEKNENDSLTPGSIICISSIAGLSGWGPIHYAAAKGGLLGFVKSLARFLAPFKIRANAVCPGVIDTGMTQGIPKAMIDGLQMITPAGRLGTADDIASAILYLASDESDFVTGQAISPNGGLVI